MQVGKEHYFDAYDTKSRWMSYYYQIDEVRKTDPENVLVVGVGNGVVPDYLSKLFDVTTVDIAEDLNPDILCSVTELSDFFERDEFDTVLCAQVLEHIPFEDFRAALSELANISESYAVISLPYSGPGFGLSTRLPLTEDLHGVTLKVPSFEKVSFEGEHYWEIGQRGYSEGEIGDIIRDHFVIEGEFIPPENPYHYFFTLRKRNEVSVIGGHWHHDKLGKLLSNDKYDFPTRHESWLSHLPKTLKRALNLPDKDVYFNEGHASKVMALAFKKIIGKITGDDFKHIVRANDRFFSFDEFPWYERIVLKLLSRYIDGVIAISDMLVDDVKKNTDLPVKKVNTALRDDSFLNVDPDIESKNLLSIGTDYPRKGNDILLDIHRSLKSDGWDGRTFVLGDKSIVPQHLIETESHSLIYTGWVDDISEYFSRACFYIHPSRYDAAACSVLEAMAAGLIPLVSENTGNKELVRQVDRGLVLENDCDDYCRKLEELMDYDIQELEEISEKCKEEASNYTFEKIEDDFKEKFWELVNNG